MHVRWPFSHHDFVAAKLRLPSSSSFRLSWCSSILFFNVNQFHQKRRLIRGHLRIWKSASRRHLQRRLWPAQRGRHLRYLLYLRAALLLTLSGKDPETRPQIGFTTIVGKMEQSQSKSYWNYIIKNLIILDRCLDCQFFVQDIANLEINHVQNFMETDPKLSIPSSQPRVAPYRQLHPALLSVPQEEGAGVQQQEDQL